MKSLRSGGEEAVGEGGLGDLQLVQALKRRSTKVSGRGDRRAPLRIFGEAMTREKGEKSTGYDFHSRSRETGVELFNQGPETARALVDRLGDAFGRGTLAALTDSERALLSSSARIFKLDEGETLPNDVWELNNSVFIVARGSVFLNILAGRNNWANDAPEIRVASYAEGEFISMPRGILVGAPTATLPIAKECDTHLMLLPAYVWQDILERNIEFSLANHRVATRHHACFLQKIDLLRLSPRARVVRVVLDLCVESALLGNTEHLYKVEVELVGLALDLGISQEALRQHIRRLAADLILVRSQRPRAGIAVLVVDRPRLMSQVQLA